MKTIHFGFFLILLNAIAFGLGLLLSFWDALALGVFFAVLLMIYPFASQVRV